MVEVVVADDVSFIQAQTWAAENCSSFVKVDVTDVSDVTIEWDEMATFVFDELDDAVWFKLKWGGYINEQ
jgi:hypothetical protein